MAPSMPSNALMILLPASVLLTLLRRSSSRAQSSWVFPALIEGVEVSLDGGEEEDIGCSTGAADLSRARE